MGNTDALTKKKDAGSRREVENLSGVPNG